MTTGQGLVREGKMDISVYYDYPGYGQLSLGVGTFNHHCF